MTPKTLAALSALALLAPLAAGAQQQQQATTPPAAAPAAAPPPALPYGMPIGMDAARKAMAAAEEEAVKNNWNVAIAIVDSGGHLVMMHRLDSTQSPPSGSPRARHARRWSSAGRPRRWRTRSRAGALISGSSPSKASRRSKGAC